MITFDICHTDHSVYPPPSFCRRWAGGGEEGGWASNQIFKKGGLTGPQLLEGGAGKELGCNFHIKNELKS